MTLLYLLLAVAAVVVLTVVWRRLAPLNRPEEKTPPSARYTCDQCNETDCICTKEDKSGV
jgi:hypothetical protein